MDRWVGMELGRHARGRIKIQLLTGPKSEVQIGKRIAARQVRPFTLRAAGRSCVPGSEVSQFMKFCTSELRARERGWTAQYWY
jgi:hypothetical protein